MQILKLITIDSPYLTETSPIYTSAIVAEVTLENNNYATLVSVDYGGGESVVIENPTGAEDLPEDWQQVTSVIANGQPLTPAINPEDPQIGEYIYNPYTNTIQIYLSTPIRSIIVTGQKQSIPVYPPLLPAPYPALFTNLPIEGQIQINRSFENQPSAQFELEVRLNKAQIQAIFAPGLELDLYGIPLRINNLSITELPRAIYPDSRCKVSASLGCKWENYLSEPCYLRADGRNAIANSDPFQDPNCTTGSTSPNDPNLSTTIPRLLSRLKLRYTGPNLAPVPIPRDTPRDATVNPIQLLQDRLRVANSFIRWSDSQAIKAIPINSLPVWNYSEWEILGPVETSYEAIARTSKKPFTLNNLNPPAPNLTNFPSAPLLPLPPALIYSPPTALAFEYPNVELSGEFRDTTREQEEATQGSSEPRYVRKPVNRTERIDGDANAHVPPDGVVTIGVMSLCFDIGGDTKNRSIVTLEDDTEVSIINETWGFAYTGKQVYNEGTGKFSGNPAQYWKCIKRTRTDYYYDPSTGYLLYIYENGYNTVRYSQESAETPETIDLDPTEDEYSLYEFFQIPVMVRTSYFLRIFPEYSSSEAVEWISVCNRDGTSSLQPLINPDFAPPYYVELERTESTAFASRIHPEDVDLTIEPGVFVRTLIVGEESRFESYTQITEATYEEKLTGFENGYPVYERSAELTPAKYVTYRKQFKAQGQQIAEAVEETTIEQGTGTPPQARRRSPQYIREEPQSKDKIEETKPQYRYYLRTQGYTVSDPVNGSESFPLAKDFNEALTAAKCKAAIENWRNGLQERLSIPGNLGIKEGDRFNYLCNGELRQRIVLSISHNFDILGAVDGKPRVTLTTNLSLGEWRLPTVDYSKVLVPSQNINASVLLDPVTETLGSTLPWSRIRSRRNPEAEEA